MSKEEIREYGYGMGVDAVGFLSVEDYKNPLTREAFYRMQNLLWFLGTE